MRFGPTHWRAGGMSGQEPGPARMRDAQLEHARLGPHYGDLDHGVASPRPRVAAVLLTRQVPARGAPARLVASDEVE